MSHLSSVNTLCSLNLYQRVAPLVNKEIILKTRPSKNKYNSKKV